MLTLTSMQGVYYCSSCSTTWAVTQVIMCSQPIVGQGSVSEMTPLQTLSALGSMSLSSLANLNKAPAARARPRFSASSPNIAKMAHDAALAQGAAEVRRFRQNPPRPVPCVCRPCANVSNPCMHALHCPTSMWDDLLQPGAAERSSLSWCDCVLYMPYVVPVALSDGPVSGAWHA